MCFYHAILALCLRVASMVLQQTYNCISASEPTLKNMDDKHVKPQKMTTQKHLCIFYGMNSVWIYIHLFAWKLHSRDDV